jgi:hypothetical protein
MATCRIVWILVAYSLAADANETEKGPSGIPQIPNPAQADSFEVPSASDMVRAYDVMDTTKVGQDPLKARLQRILDSQKTDESTPAPPSPEDSAAYEAAIGTAMERALDIERAQQELWPVVNEQVRMVEQAVVALEQENDQERATAAESNQMSTLYNAAAPVSNGVLSFVKTSDGQTSDASSIGKYEGVEDGDFEDNLQETATAVLMVEQVLDKLKTKTTPRLVNINITQESLYNTSEHMSEDFNGNARRIKGIQDRAGLLEKELTKAKEVLNVLTQYATDRAADASAAAPVEEAPEALVQLRDNQNDTSKAAPEDWLEEVKMHAFRMNGRMSPDKMAKVSSEKRMSTAAFPMDLPKIDTPPELKQITMPSQVSPPPMNKAAVHALVPTLLSEVSASVTTALDKLRTLTKRL